MNVLDLFSGAAGGWSLGLGRVGYRTVAACEIDDWRRNVFSAAHPGCRMYSDVRGLTADQLRADLGYLPDIVVGSPPCQEISAANSKGKGITDDHLFWEWARLVFEIRPLWCAAENSPRARTDGIDGILDALDQANYAAWSCVVGAENAGANHERKRLWLIASDAERFELWKQPRWSGGTNGRAEAVLGRHDPYASQQTAEPPRRRSSQSSENAEHAPIFEGLRFGRALGRRRAEPTQADLHDDPDPARERRDEGRSREAPARHGRQPAGNGSSDTDGAGYAIRPRFGSDDGAELPAALRDIGLAWPDWNGGIAGLSEACAAAGFGSLDDGAIPVLAPSLRNRAIAALGDAVVPQIPEIIGRAIMSANFSDRMDDLEYEMREALRQYGGNSEQAREAAIKICRLAGLDPFRKHEKPKPHLEWEMMLFGYASTYAHNVQALSAGQ